MLKINLHFMCKCGASQDEGKYFSQSYEEFKKMADALEVADSKPKFGK